MRPKNTSTGNPLLLSKKTKFRPVYRLDVIKTNIGQSHLKNIAKPLIIWYKNIGVNFVIYKVLIILHYFACHLRGRSLKNPTLSLKRA